MDLRFCRNEYYGFFLRVYKFAPLPTVRLEMDWLECRERRWIEMLRLFNRINIMDASRLPKLVLVWVTSLELNSWFFEIQQIAASLNLNIHPDSGEIYDLNAAHDKLLGDQRHLWQMEANRKPKLRTYVKIRDFSKNKILAKGLLSRYQRSLISQVEFRILPLKIETDRYQGMWILKTLSMHCRIY